MSNWVYRNSSAGMAYPNGYWWDPAINPNASFGNCLANCTTYTFGRILEAGDPAPVQYIYDARHWHGNLINGWTYVNYSPSLCEPGDILEWSTADYNHVAVVEWIGDDGLPYYSQSSYTGDHGKAIWPKGSGQYDRRTYAVMGSTLQSVCNWMMTNYPSRFFSIGHGGVPTYILKNPSHHGGSQPGPIPPGPGPDPDPQGGFKWWLMTPILKRKRKKGGMLL